MHSSSGLFPTPIRTLIPTPVPTQIPTVIVCAVLVALSTGCRGRVPDEVALDDGRVVVETRPLRITVRDRTGGVVYTLDGVDQAIDLYTVTPQLLPGWDGYREAVDVARKTGSASIKSATASEAVVDIAGDDDHVGGSLVVTAVGDRVRLAFRLPPSSRQEPKKTSLHMPLADDEAFFGLGERFATSNHRGQSLYSWAEEGGLGGGEDPAEALGSPFPNGASMTYFPVPFVHSSAGYSLWLDTTLRSEMHFVSTETDDPRWRVAINGGAFDIVVYATNPVEALNLYTEDSGRPTVPAPWVWGPRRRVGANNFAELARLRSAGVPTTAVDDAVHFLPHNSHQGIEEELRAWTTAAHAAGFKVMAYNNPYVSLTIDAASAEADFGRQHDLFLHDAAGQVAETFFISGQAQTLATIDLTNPEGVVFFQSLLQRTLDLGYDGWMHDFGEYVNYDWTSFDGSTGESLHNLFPVLSAKAAAELLDRERPDDHLFFVRSGYAGSQRYVPAVWGGDAEATFDETQGIPSALRSGLNLSMSGVPYWGSDGTGFKCLTDFPRDKEVYLRWAQLMAVSPIFMEQDACANPVNGRQEKWTLWSDEETTATYGAMARLHTRLQPYFEILAVQAHDTGMPLMRHLFLLYPKRTEVLRNDPGFFLGPALFAAPVVRRGDTTKQTWLPPGRYVDLDDGRVYVGDAEVTLPAPLLKLPLLLVEGELLPLLDPSIETLAEAEDENVVTPSRVADRLDVEVALAAGGSAHLTLKDGTELTAEPTHGSADDSGGVAHGDVTVFVATSDRAEDSVVVAGGIRFSARGPVARSVRWTLHRLP